MADTIQCKYHELEQIAGRFANQSEVIQQLVQKVCGSLDKLRDGGWIGQAADSFYGEMDQEVLPASHRLESVLAQASQVSRTIVQTVRDAEQEASSLFRNTR
jgi:WXG100 family type VII secretion target